MSFNVQYFNGVQVLRFFAAFIVVVCHSSFYTSERLRDAGYHVWNAGTHGVDIFFVISGFVMVVSTRKLIGAPDGWKQFIVRRLVRIVPLYWMATTASLAVLMIMPHLVLHDALDWVHIAKSYFFIPSRNIDGEVRPLLGVAWTLAFEMLFYAVFAFALVIKKSPVWFCGIVLSGLAVGSVFRPEDYPAWMVYLDTVQLEFLMGLVIGRLAQNSKYLPPLLATVGTLVSLAYLLIFVEFVDPELAKAFVVGVPAAILVYSVISLEPLIGRHYPQWLVQRGEESYSLYLFHPLSAPLAPVILNKLGIGNFTLSVVFGVAIAMIVGAAGYYLVERPSIAFFKVRKLA